ncbi:MAG: hypothetical protein WD069_16695 [Planctomycetales bacterium]
MRVTRRRFLAGSAAFGVAPFALTAQLHSEDPDMDRQEPEEGISAPEDLMREHGVLNRILLIYEEGLRRLRDKQDVPPEVFHDPATLVRKFVEDYHEKLEEKFILRMYRPHEAREDTVLFPALYQVLEQKQIEELGEQFEQEEHRLFGDEGFAKTVEAVAAIEKQLGIHDLSQFTVK